MSSVLGDNLSLLGKLVRNNTGTTSYEAPHGGRCENWSTCLIERLSQEIAILDKPSAFGPSNLPLELTIDFIELC